MPAPAPDIHDHPPGHGPAVRLDLTDGIPRKKRVTDLGLVLLPQKRTKETERPPKRGVLGNSGPNSGR
ncbi:hypothetical protein GCM10010297_52930 [Streptomyces malachitofuscus]|nr:hypothetical protein GCM10010297_52930 [Streptomyces malachitofuscus]